MLAKDKHVTFDIWDNEGKTIDRYSIAVSGVLKSEGKPYTFWLGASEQPFHPQGMGYHGGEITTREFRTNQRVTHHRNLGKRIEWEQLPDDVQRFVLDCVRPEPEEGAEPVRTVWVVETLYSDNMTATSVFGTMNQAEDFLELYRQEHKEDIANDTGDAVILADGEYREITEHEITLYNSK